MDFFERQYAGMQTNLPLPENGKSYKSINETLKPTTPQDLKEPVKKISTQSVLSLWENRGAENTKTELNLNLPNNNHTEWVAADSKNEPWSFMWIILGASILFLLLILLSGKSSTAGRGGDGRPIRRAPRSQVVSQSVASDDLGDIAAVVS